MRWYTRILKSFRLCLLSMWLCLRFVVLENNFLFEKKKVFASLLWLRSVGAVAVPLCKRTFMHKHTGAGTHKHTGWNTDQSVLWFNSDSSCCCSIQVSKKKYTRASFCVSVWVNAYARLLCKYKHVFYSLFTQFDHAMIRKKKIFLHTKLTHRAIEGCQGWEKSCHVLDGNYHSLNAKYWNLQPTHASSIWDDTRIGWKQKICIWENLEHWTSSKNK